MIIDMYVITADMPVGVSDCLRRRFLARRYRQGKEAMLRAQTKFDFCYVFIKLIVILRCKPIFV